MVRTSGTTDLSSRGPPRYDRRAGYRAQEGLLAAGKAVMLEHIMKMYNNPIHSDVTIVVGMSRIAAHRQVLATHSKVFQRMWEHDLMEVRLALHISTGK